MRRYTFEVTAEELRVMIDALSAHADNKRTAPGKKVTAENTADYLFGVLEGRDLP
jgi:hypothetical protein